MTSRTPWWWLAPDELERLGLGRGARRTELGYVFGDGKTRRRLEIVPRGQDAPVRLGPIGLRVWGEAAEAKSLLRAAVNVLGPRLADDFDPAAYAPERPDETETLIEVPSVCDRACAFCEVSLRPMAERRPRGRDDDLARAIDAAGHDVLFTGDDALSHPSIVSWIERASRGGRRISIIGPPRAGTTASLAAGLAHAGLSTWITAILGGDATAHDRIAGRDGDFAAVAEATTAMRAAGVRVDLITPLARPLLADLAAIRRAAIEMTGEPPALLAYAPDPVTGHALDHVVPTFDELRAALARLDANASVDGVPLCVLPTALASIDRGHRPARFPVVYPARSCGGCALRSRCPGAPAMAVEAVGSDGLGLVHERSA